MQEFPLVSQQWSTWLPLCLFFQMLVKQKIWPGGKTIENFRNFIILNKCKQLFNLLWLELIQYFAHQFLCKRTFIITMIHRSSLTWPCSISRHKTAIGTVEWTLLSPSKPVYIPLHWMCETDWQDGNRGKKWEPSNNQFRITQHLDVNFQISPEHGRVTAALHQSRVKWLWLMPLCHKIWHLSQVEACRGICSGAGV